MPNLSGPPVSRVSPHFGDQFDQFWYHAKQPIQATRLGVRFLLGVLMASFVLFQRTRGPHNQKEANPPPPVRGDASRFSPSLGWWRRSLAVRRRPGSSCPPRCCRSSGSAGTEAMSCPEATRGTRWTHQNTKPTKPLERTPRIG